MVILTLSRWLVAITLAAFTLVVINLLVMASPAQGRHGAAVINCSGSIQTCIGAASDGDMILIAAALTLRALR